MHLLEEIGELNKEIRGLECEKEIKSSMYYRERVSSDSDSSCSICSEQSSRSVTPDIVQVKVQALERT